MAELLSTPIPTTDSAPRGLYSDPDNYVPIYNTAHASIDQNEVVDQLVSEMSDSQRQAAEAAHPHLTPEDAARAEITAAPQAALTARLGQVATELAAQEIEATIIQLNRESAITPVTTELGGVQYGFQQAEQDRLNAPDGEAELPVGAIDTPIDVAEATTLMAKQNSPSGLTSDEERRRLAELLLAPTINGPGRTPVANPYQLADPMGRLRVQNSLDAHRTGLAPARPAGPPGSRRERLQDRSRRFGSTWMRAREVREGWGADRSATLSNGPEASSDSYGTTSRWLARDAKQGLDARSQERLSRNEFSRRGAIFRYFDTHTGVDRNFIVEGTHARQATWQPPTTPGSPPPPREPLYFLCDDGTRGEPVVLDEFGNIMNKPVGRPGSEPAHRSTSTIPVPPLLTGPARPVRMCNAAGAPVHAPDAFDKLPAGSIGINPGESTGAFRPGPEIVVYRPMFTEEEVTAAHRFGINTDPHGRGLAPGFTGDPEEVVGPRYTTVDDLVFASASDHYDAHGNNLRPRPIQQRNERSTSPGSSRSHGGTNRDRIQIIESEYVWQSEEEMSDDEFMNPGLYPPKIIEGEHNTDRGRFVHFFIGDRADRGSTRVDDALDAAHRMPPEAIPGNDRATIAGNQRTALETRDRRTRQRIPFRP